MGVVLFGQFRRPASAKPKLMERRFRVLLKCPECSAQDPTIVCVGDEPGDPGTVHDFIASGALNEIEHDCPRCGADMNIVTQVDYLRSPEEVRELA